jgi:hypothetical protein
MADANQGPVSNQDHEEGLPESKLGTKEHWDEVYACV